MALKFASGDTVRVWVKIPEKGKFRLQAFEGVVLARHALRNAMLPVATLLGLHLGHLFTGAVITETIFSWPGVGRLLYQSIQFRDYPVIQGVVLFTAVAYIAMNLLTDLAYAALDPRVRRAYGGGAA